MIAYEQWWMGEHPTTIFPVQHPVGDARPHLGYGEEGEDGAVDGDTKNENRAAKMVDEDEEDEEVEQPMRDDPTKPMVITDALEERPIVPPRVT